MIGVLHTIQMIKDKCKYIYYMALINKLYGTNRLLQDQYYSKTKTVYDVIIMNKIK